MHTFNSESHLPPVNIFFFVKIPAVKTRLVPTCYLCVFRVREGWDQVEAREDSWKGTKENFFIALLLLPASKLPYLGKQSEPRENARTRGLSPAFSRDSLHSACVASVSNRVIARKLERKQKKKKRFQSSYCAKVRADPLPRHSFFFLLLSQFSRRTSRGNACYAGYALLAQVGELARRLSLPWGLHEFPRASTYPRSSLTPKKVRVCILKDYKHMVKKNPVARSKISTLIKSPRYFSQWTFNLSTVTSYSGMEGESLPQLWLEESYSDV